MVSERAEFWGVWCGDGMNGQPERVLYIESGWLAELGAMC